VLASPGYERALVLDSSTRELSHLPPPDASKPLRNIEETVHARDRSSPAQLEVVSTYLGFEADEKRGVFSDTERLGKRYVEFYKTYEPDIEQRARPVVRDEPLKDRLVVTESYGIPRYWNDDLHDIFVEELRQLRPPRNASSRTMPLMLPYPFHVLQKVRIELPADAEPKVAQGTHVMNGPGLRAELYTTVTHEKDGPVVSITADLATTASSLDPKQVKDYAKLLNELDEASSLRIRLLTRPATTAATAIGNAPDARLGYLGFGFLGMLFGLWFGAPAMVRRFELWKSKRFYRRTQSAAGESAATPVRVQAAEDLQRFIHSRRCACGLSFFQMPLEAGESSLVGAKTVHSVRIRCPCGIATPIFFIES
jgi:hypothetical protein